jgi:winged helix DNA-binding protein
MSVRALTYEQVAGWRIERHRLVERAPRKSLEAAASEICGAQAQVMSSAELALWTRVEDVSSKDVQNALWEKRSLVKTWAMRGALHLLAAADWPVFAGAGRTRDHFRKPSWLRGFQITAPQLDRLLADVTDALGAEPLMRAELAETVGGAMGHRLLSGWGDHLKLVAYQGGLCFGPNRGRNVTFVRPSAWLGELPSLEPEDALAELVRRYLHAYGPATHEDFAVWWHMTPTAARKLFAGLDLAEVTVDGDPRWALPEDVDAIAAAELDDRVRLLPGFDALTIGWRPREGFVPEGFLPRVSRTSGWISPIVLARGRAAGMWEPKRRGKRVEVRVEPFVRVNRRKVQTEARRLADFYGLPVDVVWA